MKRRFEPFWWSLFGAGGALSALILPVLIIVFGIAVPLGLMPPPSYGQMSELLGIWWIRLIITGIISLNMFHWAHRFKYTLYEGLQLHHYHKPISIFCYGTAIIVTLLSVYLLLI